MGIPKLCRIIVALAGKIYIQRQRVGIVQQNADGKVDRSIQNRVVFGIGKKASFYFCVKKQLQQRIVKFVRQFILGNNRIKGLAVMPNGRINGFDLRMIVGFNHWFAFKVDRPCSKEQYGK